jgi:hypothetical protein
LSELSEKSIATRIVEKVFINQPPVFEEIF